MSKLRTVTLGEKQFLLGDFTMDQVSRLIVLLKQVGDISTLPQATARDTAIFIGLQSGGFAGTYDEMKQLKGIRVEHLSAAHLEVGRAIGFYLEKDAAPGEVSGEESPSQN